jgi:hypothetical protein
MDKSESFGQALLAGIGLVACIVFVYLIGLVLS